MNLSNMNLTLLLVIGLATSIGTQIHAQDYSPLPAAAAKETDTPAKIELGKKLFFDPRLSLSGTVSCNTCHNLMEGGDDGRDVSMGINGLTGTRNSPTVWNSVFQASQFWDGRAGTLEDQAKGPLIDQVEMGMVGHKQVMERVKQIPKYVDEFQQVFSDNEPVTIDNAVDAIAAFERTLITPNSAFDRFLLADKSAMTEQQIRGMVRFESVGCTECHSGPALNGWTSPEDVAEFIEFPRNWDSEYVKRYDLVADVGRARLTKDTADEHYFKTPVLRNVTLTAPYMHNGLVPSLDEAIRVMASTQLDTELTDDEVSDIVAFFSALEGKFPEITLPRIPSRSGKSIMHPDN